MRDTVWLNIFTLFQKSFRRFINTQLHLKRQCFLRSAKTILICPKMIKSRSVHTIQELFKLQIKLVQYFFRHWTADLESSFSASLIPIENFRMLVIFLGKLSFNWCNFINDYHQFLDEVSIGNIYVFKLQTFRNAKVLQSFLKTFYWEVSWWKELFCMGMSNLALLV